MPNLDDTIVAVSSPPGRSRRGLVRLSGDATRDVLKHLTGDVALEPRRITPVQINRTLPALATFFDVPRTYTGQDMAELQVPGNPALMDRLIHQAMSAGARLAEPGEFTFRAFVAGKIDLTQAEGVAATIAATSDGQLQAAAHLRDGELGRFAHELVDALANQLALVEAGIDFTDQEDVVPIEPAQLNTNLDAIAKQLDDLLRHSRSWSSLEGLPRVVLVGPPSAGKSTLFNALLRRTRAVISPSPGTTRDVLAEPLTLIGRAGQPVEVMLIDVAGLDEPRNALDDQIQSAARRAIDEADLVLSVDDGSGISDLKFEISDLRSQISVRTKTDLLPTPPAPQSPDIIPVSAVTGFGLDSLRSAIARHIGDRAVSVAAEMLALQPRHENALRSAASHIENARLRLQPQLDRHGIDHVELVADAMRSALDELTCLGGQMTPDDVIGRVFATFCVGK